MDAIEQVRNALGRKASPKWVMEGDIKGCFDNISHEWLIANICMDKGILRKWLAAGYVEMGRLFPTKAGTPQGGIISPVLANLALDGLQSELQTLFRTVREAREAKVNFIRYADDFVITASSQEFLEERVKPLVRNFLAKRGLILSEEKTKITHVTEEFDFLGWNVRYRKSMLLIEPSKTNTKAFLNKIRTTLKEMGSVRQDEVIDKLTPMIRGWANYHRSQMVTRIFKKCDHQIWQALWRWACRRHPNKGKRWIKQRYFISLNGRDWRFATKDKALPFLCEFRKRTHIKVKADANPYDPAFDEYFSKRLGRKMGATLRRHAIVLAGEHTFMAVYEQWLAHRRLSLEEGRQTSLEQIGRVFKKDVFPSLRHLTIYEITRAHLLDIIGKVEKRGSLSVAEKLRTWFTQLFTYATVAIPNMGENPSRDLEVVALPLPPVEHNPFLRMHELPVVLQALRKYRGRLNTQLGLRLLMLTGVRTGGRCSACSSTTTA